MLSTTTGSLAKIRQRNAGFALAAGLLAVGVFVALTTAADAAQFQLGSNGQIAFTRNDGGDDDIFVMGNDGSNPTNLTPGSPVDDLQPTFSPDGQTIVFNRSGDLFTMSATGANQAPLTNGAAAFQATFTPDGTKIVFTRV